MSDLEQIRAEVTGCTRCPLAGGRTKTVPGEGPADAEIMLIGEGPGFNEDKQGRPFVGQAGHLLEELLVSIGLTRTDVFITNVVKCRPPGNRDPMPSEIAACSDYLDRQIAAIRPKIIATLGRHSMAKFLPGKTISRIHGQPVRWGDGVVLPLYHPAAALHQQALRPVLFEDFKKLADLLSRARRAAAVSAAAPGAGPAQAQPKQLSMF
ncbi:MAG TPA: uracil-DNA glycosylase [Dehalococcoidia bacterium]|nr:uracil-DNA glycosylase [Dehalococcoidia bacterium]